MYRRRGEAAEIIFENTGLGIRKTIVDDSGHITGFPGVAHPELLSCYTNAFMMHTVRFRSEMLFIDGHYIFIWQVQPDGQYWEDEDGFGRTSDDEIDLYSPIDESGGFMDPFRIYSVGINKLYGTDIEDGLQRTFSSGGDPLSCLKEHIPEMLEEIAVYMDRGEKGDVIYSIPGTVYQAILTAGKSRGSWLVETGMTKALSGSKNISFMHFPPQADRKEYVKTDEARIDVTERLIYLFKQISS